MTRGPQAVWWGFAAGLALSTAVGSVAAQPLRIPMAETGVPGGRFVIGTLSDAKTFNPILSNESSSSDVSDRLFTALVETDNLTRRHRPALATSWESNRDGRVWTWHLRRGARFSDGHPITAADVLFSFAVAYDSTLHPSIYDLLSPHGRRIQVSAPDSYTVVMRLARPHALLVDAVGALRILPRHVLEPAWRAGRFASSYGVGTRPESLVTSGPWRLKQFVPHEKTVLTRNPYWFGVDARGRRLPYLDELVFLVVPDQNTCSLKFEAGELDALDNVKAEDYRRFERGQARGGYVVHRLGPSLTSNFFWFNLNTVKRPGGRRPVGTPYADPVRYAWFSNRDFRRAVSMAVDRQAIIRSVYFGEGEKGWSILTPGYGAFYDRTVTAPDHDPAGARRLLARLGFRDRDRDGVLEDPQGHPVRFTLKTNAGSVRVQMANFVRDDLARVGIQCNVAAVDYNTLIVNMREDFDYDAILAGLGGAVPPDPAMCGNFYRSSGATHFWNVRQTRPETPAEARVDSLFDRLLLPGTLAERRGLSSRIDRILDEECWLIWLPVMKVELPVRDRFGNVAPNLLPHRVLWNSETVFVRPGSRRPGR
jgi:peptide/nickel transport system substrate-binding protein